MENQAKIKKYYLVVFIDIFLVLGKKPCSLAAKLWKIAKH